MKHKQNGRSSILTLNLGDFSYSEFRVIMGIMTGLSGVVRSASSGAGRMITSKLSLCVTASFARLPWVLKEEHPRNPDHHPLNIMIIHNDCTRVFRANRQISRH